MRRARRDCVVLSLFYLSAKYFTGRKCITLSKSSELKAFEEPSKCFTYLKVLHDHL